LPVITVEPVEGFAHCLRRSLKHEPCYAQQEVPALRETIAFLYSDGWGGAGASGPQDAMVGGMVEREVVHIRFADEADRECPHCGGARECTDMRRPEYPALSGVPQDELVQRERAATTAAVDAASAGERQAAALEALVAQGQQASEVEQLRADMAEQSRQIDLLLAAAAEPANGHTAKPRKRADD
jgi:hypothetical protein